MNHKAQAVLDGGMLGVGKRVRTIHWERMGILYTRIAVGAAFLSAVASRLGFWDGSLDLKHFANFIEYTAAVNSFLPRAVIPGVAVLATGSETLLGNPFNRGSVATVGFAGKRRFACHVWNGHGDIIWAQVSNGLFSFLCFRRVRFIGPRCIPWEQIQSRRVKGC